MKICYFLYFIRNQLVPESDNLKFTGKHHTRNSNNDVINVIFDECNISKIPKMEFKLTKNHKI